MALTKISSNVIANNTIAVGNIADNSVDATKIASNSILTRHIDDDQITGDQLADNITIAGTLTSTGALTASAGITSTASANSLGATSFNEADLTNVGTIYADQYLGDADADSGIVLPGSDIMTFHTANSERMRIDANGNFSLGSGANASNFSNYVTLDLRDSTGGIIDFSEASAGVHSRIQAVVNNSLNILNRQNYPLNLGTNDTTRLTILGNGNVGIGGNASPAQALEVYRNSDSGSAGGYAGISLRNDHSSGYMAVQFHEGGTLRGDILFQNGTDAMQFRVGGGGTERMRITDAGTLLISTNAASGLSNSNSNFGHSFGGGQQVNSTNNDLTLILNRSNGSGTMLAIRNDGSNVGSITQDGSSTSFNTSSDYRLKENVDYTWDATTRLKQLKPVRFNFIADDSNTTLDGFLAHEVSSIVPGAVHGEKDDMEMQQLDHSKLVPLLVKTIQELEARIATLET